MNGWASAPCCGALRCNRRSMNGKIFCRNHWATWSVMKVNDRYRATAFCKNAHDRLYESPEMWSGWEILWLR